MDTATWDETNPEDIICVIGARGKSQTIHGRSVAETQGRIPKTLVSEFGFTQPEADEFAKMAASQVGKPKEIDELRDAARRLTTINKQQSQQIVDMQAKVAAAEKDRDAAIAEKKIVSTSLDQATAKVAQLNLRVTELQKPPPAPPTPPAQEKSDASKDEKPPGTS